MRFYGYTLQETLAEYAKSFYSLVNTMYRLKAEETLVDMTAYNGDNTTVEQLQKQRKGLHGLLKEVRIAKRLKK